MAELARKLQTVPTDVAALLRAIFLPKLHANGLRLASEGAGIPSAAANMSVVYDTSNWPAATVTSELPPADQMYFLFCNPLRSLVYYIHNPTNTAYAYQLIDPLNGTVNFTLKRDVEIELRPRFAQVSTTFAPHSTLMFPGYDENGHYYLWVQSGVGGNMTVLLNGSPASNGIGVVKFFYWDGKHAALYSIQEFLSGQSSYNIVPPNGGAYMFASVQSFQNTISSATVTINGSGDIWAHVPVPDIQTLLLQAYGIRVNAASIRIQNDSSPLNRNGNIIGVTVAKSINWTQIATSASALSQLQNYREFTADKGYYGVPLPDSDEDVSEFFDDISAPALRAYPTMTQMAYPLQERRPYKAVSLNVPQTSGRSFTAEITHALEYLTNNKLVSQALSKVSEKSVADAIAIASTLETDFENYDNWRETLATIRAMALSPDSTPAIVGVLSEVANDIPTTGKRTRS